MTRLSRLSRSIAGRRAVVTGAASGMGRATAELFADEGAGVIAVDVDGDRLDEVVDRIAAVHGPAAVHGVVADLADPDSAVMIVAAARTAVGGIDILVNNAGISLPVALDDTDAAFETRWSATLAVNLDAQVRLVRAALDDLRRSEGGRVVNIASTEALVATAGLAAYAASKAGVIGLTRSLAVELGRHAVTVNCICPGPIETAMTAAIPGEAKATYARRRVPLGRYGLAEEVAQMTLSLCLPAASYVTGAVLTVDGGMSIRHT